MTDWGSVYGGGSGGGSGGTDWGSVYGGGSSGGSTTKKSSGGWLDSITNPISHYLGGSGPLGGVESTIGNAVGQGADIIHGLPQLYHVPQMAWHDITRPHTSLIDLISNPAKGWKGIGSELHDPKGLVGATYMPFAADVSHAKQGDWHYFQQHPLNPILDVAAAASLGGAGALRLARVGALGERAGTLARSERILTATGEHEFPVRLNEARTLQGRIRQQWFDRYSMANPDKRIVGVDARVSRILNQRAAVSMLRARVPVRQFQRLTQKLTPSEKFAFHVAAEDVPLDDRIAFYKAQIAIKPTKMLRDYTEKLESPGVRDALTNPRPEFTAALWKGHGLEAAAGERLVQSGIVSPESRTERAARPREMMGSGAPETTNSIHPDFPPAYRFWHTGGTGKSLEGSLMSPETGQMLGKAAPLGQAKRSLGARLEAAAFQTDPERVLSVDYLSTMRHELILGMQKEALLPISNTLSAEHVGTGFKAPDEWYFRPSFDRKTTAPIDRPTREAPNLTQDRQALDVEMQQGKLRKASQDVVSKDVADLVKPGEILDPKDLGNLDKLNQLGIRRIPNAYGKDFLREFHGTSAFVRNYIDRPLDVWRAITLNLRPAWAVNNLVGNAAMGILSHPSSAYWYLKTLLSVRPETGWREFSKIWKWTKQRPHLYRVFHRVFEDISAEQNSAGLFGTQTKRTNKGIHADLGGPSLKEGFRANPAVRALGFTPKMAGKVVMGVGRGITRLEVLLAEDTGREAVFIAAAGGDLAKIRAAARAMGEGNLKLEEALRRLDESSVERASSAVADALGNFNDLSHVERAFLRRIIPFYSWFKVITKVSAKYAARYPARVKLLQSIAQAQDKSGEPDLPSWLTGAITLGKAKNGTQPLLSTQGINPYETIPQLAEGGPIGVTNPLIAAAFPGAAGRNAAFGTLQDYYGPGATNRPGWPGFAERYTGALFGGLAPARLLIGLTTPYQGKLYDPTTYRRNLLLQYLGLPVRDVKVQEAKRERGL